MTARPVRETRRALLDVVDAATFIRDGLDESASNAWLVAYRECLNRLELFAGGCGVAPESEQHSLEIRQQTFRTRTGRRHRVLFTIHQTDDGLDEGEVVILRVRLASQRTLTADEVGFPD